MIQHRILAGVFASVALASIAFAGWNIYLAMWPLSDAPCTLAGHPADSGLVNRWWYVLGAFVALILGRVVSRTIGVPPFAPIVLAQPQQPSVSTTGPKTADSVRRAQIAAAWVQSLIVILLTAALVGLGYETIGVSHSNNPWPLTFLVRCLNEGSRAHVTSYSTFAVAMVVAFIIGNWFWPEPPSFPQTSVSAGQGG